MRITQISVSLLAALASMNAHAAYTRLTCIVDDFADGKPKTIKLVFEEPDRSWVIANGSRHPHTDYSGTTELVVFDEEKIEWCETPPKSKETEPIRTCYAINRITSNFRITQDKTGTAKEGECLVGRNQEKRRF